MDFIGLFNNRTKELEEEVAELTVTIQELQLRLELKEKKCKELKEFLEKEFELNSSYISKTHLLYKEIDELKAKTAIASTPHNARGAGRRSKVTADVIVRVKDLKSEGKSLSQIATLLTLETGVNYSKSAIKKIVDLHIKGNKSCVN